MAHVKPYPAPTFVTFVSVFTVTGVSADVPGLLSPSAPLKSSPQHLSLPLDAIAHVCDSPPAMRPKLFVMQFAIESHWPHQTWPAPQQCPELQTPVHTVVQLPQWFLSMDSSTQTPPQS